ncbi:BZIP transcription factor [Colletotrichum tofieldiae]|nr:BZIP transcription factor [Colletotrichum tofieldiae]
MAQLATDELPEAILQRLKDGETVSQNPKVDSSRGTSATGQSKHSTKSVDGFVKPEEDDEPPLPPGIVPWQIDKMHYLLHLLFRRVPPPGAVEAFGNLPLSCAVRANYYPAAVQARQLLNLQTEEYRLPSFIASDGSPLSNLFYSYRDAAMEMLSKGVPSFQVLGPSDRIDLELFFRDREPHDTYDVHSWACELVKNIEGYDIFVQLASIALYTTYIRWNILPTATNYALMPAMIRPTQRQRFVPHRMTIDLVPHPAIRDALINKFRDWLSPGTTDTGGTSVGWPYSLDAAVDVCPITGRRMLSRAFFEHATNGSNWSLDKSIRAMYPEIEGMGFKIRD